MKGNGVPLVVTYNTNCKNLNFLIRKNLQFLYAYPKTLSQIVFKPALFVSFRSAGNLKSFIVKSKVYELEKKVGPAKCNGKCRQVSLDINETDTVDSFQTKQKYKINHYLSCNDKCSICLWSCKICGLQYVDSKIDKFCFRWNNFKKTHRKALIRQEHMQLKLF